MSATLTVRGISAAAKAARERLDRLKNLKPALEVGAAALVKHIDDRFHTSTDPSGIAWEPLDDATIAKRRGTTAKILVDTARLRNSIHASASAKGITWGTNVVYAAPHQNGTEDIPQRRFLPVLKEGNRYVLDTSGPAGALWQRIQSTIATYVRDGKLR